MNTSEQPLQGFECDFVEPPPTSLESTECLICKKIIREPHQAICCGTDFCDSCVKQSKESESICPNCNENGSKFQIYPNTSLKKRLYKLLVHCTNKSEGCVWIGELGQLDEHLNSNPSKSDLFKGCEYTVIECLYAYAGCSVTVPRKDLETHLSSMKTKHEVIQAELQISLLHRVQELHQENESLKQEKLQLREKVNDQESTLQYKTQQIDDMQSKIDTLVLQQEMASRTGMAIGPVRFTMEGFNQHKQTPDDNWFSPHFWTHPQGYKVCLCIIANGEGPTQGEYTSVLIHMMKGEFDEHLKWPFRGIITVTLLDQEGGEDHWSKEVHITPRTPDEVACRVLEGERTKKGWGLFQFIPHSELEPKYLKNDQLCFEIGQIKLTM